jgi:hypothetical protein
MAIRSRGVILETAIMRRMCLRGRWQDAVFELGCFAVEIPLPFGLDGSVVGGFGDAGVASALIGQRIELMLTDAELPRLSG